ncbi:MAG: NAD(P)H-dependent oxidoreductase [Turicibacter sp.]|nr:NAD(P)H-dependent oxidoreductase [Turicibacter sp.]
MKLLIVNGTPKQDGLCYSFVERAEKTAADLGVACETIRLAGLNLKKCQMCSDGWGICFREHRCVFGDKDGFDDLQKKVAEADAYAYITPVYWGEISEEFKIFLDKLRRCEATKQWDARPEEVSFLKGKPSIVVASAGGGGGGIISTFADFERAITQMGADEWPRETHGIFDFIAVNRWNKNYKLTAFGEAIKEMIRRQKMPNATSVTAQENYTLLCTFDNGESRIFDMKPFLENMPELKDEEIFKKVSIAGVQIEWRPLLSIEISELYE